MNNQILGILAFLVILTIYVTLLIVIASGLPILFLTGMMAWFILRRPFTNPDRIDHDVEAFGKNAGLVARRLAEVLIRPLSHRP